MALDIGPGDEVITTPFTFVSTAETIVQVGAKPVFVDISLEDFNLEPENIARAITAKTRGIIAVHLYGQPARMPEICDLAGKQKISVIEDTAQAHGAKIAGKPVGTFGDIATFSFYPGKNLGAYGDAGAVASTKKEFADRMRLLRDHGRSDKYTYREIGYNCRLDGLQGAILRAKLPHLAKWNRERQRCAETYHRHLQGVSQVILPPILPKAQSVFHLFVIRHPKRDALQKALQERGIPSLVHYPLGLHLQPCFQNLGYREGDLPNTDRAGREVLSLPCYPELSDASIKTICDAIKDALKG
jgi:dTDP-4-amino-4,6-dideoxygalactose transaminase